MQEIKYQGTQINAYLPLFSPFSAETLLVRDIPGVTLALPSKETIK